MFAANWMPKSQQSHSNKLSEPIQINYLQISDKIYNFAPENNRMIRGHEVPYFIKGNNDSEGKDRTTGR